MNLFANMKSRSRCGASLLLATFLMACLSARSDFAVFGNAPNGGTPIGIQWAPYHFNGGAVGFIPLHDISVSSVTFWLTGYTGKNGQSNRVTIEDNMSVPYSPSNKPSGSDVISFNPAPFNDGSIAPFTFTNAAGSTVLKAGQEYWLVAVGMSINFNVNGVNSYWMGGGTPSGDAVYDQCETFTSVGGYFSSAPYTPAFTINSAAPTLNIASSGSQFTLSWPAAATNYVLQCATDPASTNWTAVSNAAGGNSVTITNQLQTQFFRLAGKTP